jgi:hypothetical protein
MVFTNSVLTPRKTPHFTITEVNWLKLFKEIIDVYTENCMKPVNKSAALAIVKADGIRLWKVK